jgi:ZIP family zinc transporter
MVDYFVNLHPVFQAFLATCFTWFLTALGAAGVFFTRTVNKRILDPLLGFAGGVMIAASYWSLGGVCLRLVDKLLPHLHLFAPIEEAEGISTSWRRTTLLVMAITLHNIPEGLAVGVAFGAVAHGLPTATLPAAIALAVGIGLQNFPEGMAVSMPLRREGVSRLKSFWYGQLSGIVEPIAGVIGAAAVIVSQPILPYALAFAAGAMIFVVVEEVIPESQRGGNADSATMGLMIGFTVMMILDVSLG